jgi:hypothetical protein
VPLRIVRALLVSEGMDGKTIRGGWSSAYRSFPNRKLLTVSAVGFDATKTLALVTVQYNCGLSGDARSRRGDCHGGRHMFPKKEAGGWIRERDLGCTWIS